MFAPKTVGSSPYRYLEQVPYLVKQGLTARYVQLRENYECIFLAKAWVGSK